MTLFVDASKARADSIGNQMPVEMDDLVAWYAHLRNLSSRPWYVAALVSWGIALFEYLLQVPANRIGYTALSLA